LTLDGGSSLMCDGSFHHARRPRRHGLWEARIPGVQVSGTALAEIGLAIAPQRTLTAAVVLVEAL
jgi:hypothetical protein